jgi:hypothetical protein
MIIEIYVFFVIIILIYVDENPYFDLCVLLLFSSYVALGHLHLHGC